jgi:hypothetical protein
MRFVWLAQPREEGDAAIALVTPHRSQHSIEEALKQPDATLAPIIWALPDWMRIDEEPGVGDDVDVNEIEAGLPNR